MFGSGRSSENGFVSHGLVRVPSNVVLFGLDISKEANAFASCKLTVASMDFMARRLWFLWMN